MVGNSRFLLKTIGGVFSVTFFIVENFDIELFNMGFFYLTIGLSCIGELYSDELASSIISKYFTEGFDVFIN